MTEFVPLPNSEPAVKRVRKRKAQLYDLIADLHELHLTSGVIGKILGLDRGYIRDILHDMGLHQHWSQPADVMASLPLRLRNACLIYTTGVDKMIDQSVSDCPTIQSTAVLARPKET